MKIEAKNSSLNNFNFSFKTSSGDDIKFDMFDKKELEYLAKDDENSSSKSLSLTHEYGYKFSYQGNGLDEKDMKEIKEAMEKIRPLIDKFMKDIADDKPFSKQDINNLASEIKNQLPELKDENTKNYASNRLLFSFDELLKNQKPVHKILKQSNELFGEILKQFDNKFSFYA